MSSLRCAFRDLMQVVSKMQGSRKAPSGADFTGYACLTAPVSEVQAHLFQRPRIGWGNEAPSTAKGVSPRTRRSFMRKTVAIALLASPS